MTKDNINIAFAFDFNFYRQAVIAILSLLDQGPKIKYEIYCIIDFDITPTIQSEIKKLILNKSSLANIHFIEIGNYFNDAYECRGITKAAYYRLMLHRLLPVDKVIYSDVDVLFKTDLSDIWQLDMSLYCIGQIIDCGINTTAIRQNLEKHYLYWKQELAHIRKNYRMSGFLLLNLKKIREINFDHQILELSKNNYLFQDQDILNILFSKRQDLILPISPAYAMMPRCNYKQALKEGIITEKEFNELRLHPCIIHYSGAKPWDNITINMANEWWDYVKLNTPYYRELKKRYHNVFFKRILKSLKKKILSVETKEKDSNKYKIIRCLGFKIKYKIY